MIVRKGQRTHAGVHGCTGERRVNGPTGTAWKGKVARKPDANGVEMQKGNQVASLQRCRFREWRLLKFRNDEGRA